MSHRGLVLVALAVTCALVLSSPSRSATPVGPWKPAATPPAPPAERPVRWIGQEPDTGQYLPDTVLIARVDDRIIRVRDYIQAYFNSYPEYRPLPDSAGRLEFLNTLLNKEVLGITARAVNRPLGFEDRVTLREHTQRVLSNIIFQRAVVESSTVTEDEIRRVYEQNRYQQHMRHIVFGDRATAEKVRGDLVAGRIAWQDAVRRYSIAPDRESDGDLGWSTRVEFDPVMAEQVYALEPGQISSVVRDVKGYHLMQSVERRAVEPPAYEGIRTMLREQIRGAKHARRADQLQGILRAELGMAYDTTNIAWAASQFGETTKMTQSAGGPTLELSNAVPEFAAADTGRVLARHRDGQLTLGGFLESYLAATPLMRPNVNDFEAMRAHIDATVLEPYMAELAVKRGLDKDPLAIRLIENRREEILVDHMYQDSIMSKVWVRPEERHKYYREHQASFVTYPKVRYAAFVRDARDAADSLAARLRAGEKAVDLLRADSLLGRTTGSIQERSAGEHGTPYYRLLFEELRPGQLSVEGPDRQGDYLVIQLLTYEPERQMSFKEVLPVIDESLQNIRAEQMLKSLLERHRKRHMIEAHPELLGRVLLVDPTLLE